MKQLIRSSGVGHCVVRLKRWGIKYSFRQEPMTAAVAGSSYLVACLSLWYIFLSI